MQAIVGSLSFKASAAMDPYRRVKLTSGKLALAGASDDEIGTLEQRALAADTPAAVTPPVPGTVVWMVASKAIAQYAAVYAAADGKVTDTSSNYYRGIALDAAAGDGVQIRVLRLVKSPTSGS